MWCGQKKLNTVRKQKTFEVQIKKQKNMECNFILINGMCIGRNKKQNMENA